MSLERITKFITSALFGGTTGQVLKKNSNTDGDYSWADNIGVTPTGGTTNQVLAKNSGTNYDYSWKDVGPLTRVTAAGLLTDGAVTTDLYNTITSTSYTQDTTGTGGTCTWDIVFDLPFSLTSSNFVLVANGAYLIFDAPTFINATTVRVVGRYLSDAQDAAAMSMNFTMVTLG